MRIERIWEDLANAIVLRAVEDYRDARWLVRNLPDQFEARQTIVDVEEFLLSPWFALLTDVDGEWLLKRLKEEVVCRSKRI